MASEEIHWRLGCGQQVEDTLNEVGVRYTKSDTQI